MRLLRPGAAPGWHNSRVREHVIGPLATVGASLPQARATLALPGLRAAARRLRPDFRASLTLLNLFVLTSGAILLVGAIVLASTLTKALWNQSVRDAQADVAEYADMVFGPTVVRGDRIVVDAETRRLLERHLRARPDLLSAELWARNGNLLWASVDTSRVGRRLELVDELERVMASAQPIGGIGAPAGAGGLLPEDGLLVYAPVRGDSGNVIGAYQVYVDASELNAVVAEGVRTIWLLVGGVFILLYFVIVVLARGASRRLRHQTKTLAARSAELEESYLRLQENALGAVESLNATVEAKDPYTAGHSQRVRRLAMAIGGELGLDANRLEALGTSALFHDIGKIAVPDAILTKPGRLEQGEFELIKEHAAKGAEIVGKLPQLADTVPAIRHHHERWDGRGYPDGLRAWEIPLEAAIVGLADAWDAMTTARPYSDALSLEDALRNVRKGRGTQFHPRVADAFLDVAACVYGELDEAPETELELYAGNARSV
jgi:putative nucleotidyltransferase with HDIG domain